MIFVGDDWSEDHHDIEVQDGDGTRLIACRLPEGAAGMARLHALVGELVDDPAEVVLGIETDRGLWVAALVAAGYEVHAINPKAASRYRERYAGGSGAKSDPGDARVLADAVRTDRHIHRRVAGDSDLAQGVKVLARAHQRLVWSRQRQLASMRSLLREYYPSALVSFDDLGHRDALAVLGRAPTPQSGRRLSKTSIVTVLRRSGRRRYLEPTAERIQAALRSEQLDTSEIVAGAYGHAVTATVAIVVEMTAQLETMETALTELFDQHPDAPVLRSQPGIGPVVGARLLAEFGDDPTRYADVKARRNYAGTSPITVASGKRRVVKARHAGNRHLADTCYWWAFCALTTSRGARAYYDRRRAAGASHDAALRALANRLVGQLDGCLRRHRPYDEDKAWAGQQTTAA